MQQMDQQTSITPNCGGIKINGTINAGGVCWMKIRLSCN
jgi:hypothetical protein